MRMRIGPGMGILLPGLAAMAAVTVMSGRKDVGGLWQELWPWTVVLAAAAVHECGHMAAAWSVGARIRGLTLDLLGARMELEGFLSYGEEILVAAGGPFVSLAGAALAYPLWVVTGVRAAGLFAAASGVLGLLNLLPVGTLDGGRILFCGTAWLWGESFAHTLLKITTGLLLIGLWMLAVYGLLRAGEMLSLFAFSMSLLARTWDGLCTEKGDSKKKSAKK